MKSILEENQEKRINVPLPLLCCFAMFTAWQMGVIYFTGSSLSLGGRTPIPVTLDNAVPLIAAAYIASAVFLAAFQKYSVAAARVVMVSALFSGAAMFLPLPTPALAGLFYFQIFCCVFMIGIGISIVVNLFTEKTELLDVAVISVLGNLLVAVLQNDAFPLPFSVFRLFTVAALALLCLFFFHIPAKVWPNYVEKKDGLTAPGRLFLRMFMLIALSCVLTLFGSAVAESVNHGMCVLYVASGVAGVIFFLLWKKKGISPLSSSKVFICIAMLGFVINSVIRGSAVAGLVACAMIGCGLTVCNLASFFGIVISKKYPWRWTVPLIIVTAMCAILIQSGLLEFFRERVQLLYGVYAVVAAVTAVLYVNVEPFMAQSLREERRSENVTEKAETEKEEAEKEKAETAGMYLSELAYDRLSAREQKIAELILEGYTSAEMASHLKLAESTVKSYRKSLYSKLQIHSRKELFDAAKKSAKDNNKSPEQ